MNIRSITSNLVTLSLGAWVAACGAGENYDAAEFEGAGEEDGVMLSSESFGNVAEELTSCDDNDYDHWKYLSGLAVATANEIGRWDPNDFTVRNSRVELSTSGLSRCAYGCSNVLAILQMQDDATSIVARHDPAGLRALLTRYLQQQKDFNAFNPVPNHVLSYVGNGLDVCGLRYHFKVGADAVDQGSYLGKTELIARHSFKCIEVDGLSKDDGARSQQWNCWGGTNQRFVVEAKGGENYWLRNENSGKCLGVVADSTANGATLEQRTCGATRSQTFQLSSLGYGRFRFKNANSGKCLDIKDGGKDDGAVVQQWSCSTAMQQDFVAPGVRYRLKNDTSPTELVPSGVELMAAHSFKCIDLWKGNFEQGGGVQQYYCWGAANQKFSVDSLGSGQYRLRSAQSGLCLSVVNGSTADDARFEQRTCGATDSQKFSFRDMGVGRIEIKNTKSGKCVDVSSWSLDNGAPLHLWPCTGTANQQFYALGTTSASLPTTSPSGLANQLRMFGHTDNRYLMFAATNTEVSIDPMGTMIDGGSSASAGLCYEGSTAYSSASLAGACCSVNGVFKTLVRSPFNPKMYICK
jgi:hypothetical protein